MGRALRTISRALGIGAAATAGAAVVNARLAANTPELGPAIDADIEQYAWDGGRVSYYTGGKGHPVLLLHSHNAAASAYEVRRLFKALEPHYRVFAPDLPGYGLSERRDREYTAHTYVRFLHDFVHDVIGDAAVVIAPSVTAAQALLAIDEDAHAFTHLVAVSPTGLDASMIEPPAAARSLGGAALVPVWGQFIYNGIASRKYIRQYLEGEVYHDPWHVTHEMVEYNWATAHQPNARFAPAGFLSGDIWTDARAAYADVQRPVLLVWGEFDKINPYERSKDGVSLNPQARVEIIPDSGAAPYDEQVDAFTRVLVDFLSETGAPPDADV